MPKQKQRLGPAAENKTEACDVTLVLPSVYTDHPSFPEALLRHALEKAGFRVAITAQPRWQGNGAFARLPKPKLFFAIVPGAVDSVVLNYTSTRKRRQEDLYQFDGKAYFCGEQDAQSISSKIRPDRVLTVFAARIRESFKDIPIIIGGLEGSLRRFTHWDFQQEKVRRPILLDTRADLLVAGMGEKQIVRIAEALAAGEGMTDARALILPGTVRVASSPPADAVLLPRMEEVLSDPSLLIAQYQAEQEALQRGRPAAQACGKRWVIYEGPERYASGELDALYSLPFTRAHTHYTGQDARGDVRTAASSSPHTAKPGKASRMTPALRMNLFSVTTHRGCAGGCAFCAISAHGGRGVVSRSRASIMREIAGMQTHPLWRGIVGDLGAASAEMYGADCARAACLRASCLVPGVCGEYAAQDGRAWQALLAAARNEPGVKKIMLGSGVRYEVFLANPGLLEDVLTHHAGRFLRVAPEHTEDHVLALMRKPPHALFVRFVELFRATAARLPRSHPVELACYIVVGHPGESALDVARMRTKLEALGLMRHLDVQIFTPAPGSLSTALYAGGRDKNGNQIIVERSVKELIRRQRSLIEPATMRPNVEREGAVPIRW
jgi:radical SAM superfamily enzyme YgiQ (UPF0313 family)